MPICPKCRGENSELGAKCPRDEFYYIHEGALEDAERDPWIGRLAADKYVIVALISEGGMGAVYRAIQLPVQREIAFKVLLAELQDSDQGRDRFAREARAISRLSHPNIITMHDFGVDAKGHPFMAMEYAPGRSLADWMMTPGLSLERICHVFRQILSALSEAHEQGVIHRDLKPENLIVTRAGNDPDYIKLLDFGIARMVHDTATRGLTRDGEVFGTPHYMSPEQARGQKDIGPPADVYALGIMFFELLSGDCPFDAPTPLSILYMHINDDLPELRPKNQMQVPDALREVIATATAKAPEDRYPHAGAMLDALNAALGEISGLYQGAPMQEATGHSPEAPVVPAGSRDKMGTANTLLFGPTDAPVVPAGAEASNAVAVDDPKASHASDEEHRPMAFNGPNMLGPSNGLNDPNMDTALDLERRSPAKFVVAGMLVALLLGGGAWGLFFAPGAADGGQEVEAGKEAQLPGVDPPPEALVQDERPAQPATPAQPSTEPANPSAPAAMDSPAAERPDALPEKAPKPARKTAKTRSDAAPAVPKKPANARVPSDEKSAELKPSSASSAAKKTDQNSQDSGENTSEKPEKFQPAKFAPRTNTPKKAPAKFQPKKWN